MDISIFQFISKTIDNATNNFLVDGLEGLMSAISPLLVSGIAIYIMMQAYLSIMGKSDDLAFDVFKHCLVVICITGLALNIENYTTYVIGSVESIASGLASAVSGQSQGNDVYQSLDGLLQKGLEQVGYSVSQVGMRPSSWTWFFVAIAIIAAIGSLTLTSAIIIIGTKFLLTFLLILGPLFLVFACFPATKRYLDSWVAKIFENCLVQVLGVMVITLAIAIIDHLLTIYDVNATNNPIAVAVQIVIVVGILLYVIRQIPNLAGSLAGGFASSSMSIKDLNPFKDSPRRQQQADPSPKDNGRKGRETWEQQQANKITSGNNQSKDPVSRVVRDQIEKHNRMNK